MLVMIRNHTRTGHGILQLMMSGLFIIDKFHYFIRAVLEKNLPLQEYILKFMQFAEENPDTIVIADEIGNGIVPLDAFEREYREQTGRAEILHCKKSRGRHGFLL